MAMSESQFQHLYSSYNPILYNFCITILKNPTDVDDVLQLTWLTAWLKFNQLRSSKALSWLFKIAQNYCLNIYRYRQHHPEDLTDSLPDFPSFHCPSNKILLDQLYSSMPKGYKAVFRLANEYGYTFSEISSILHISIGTAKSQNHKAKQWLNRHITYPTN